MTIVKEARVLMQENGKQTISESKYYEVGTGEVMAMLKKVSEGGDEIKLREDLIKNSKWNGGK